MAGFNFEKELPHQERGMKSTLAVFKNVPLNQPTGPGKEHSNPRFEKDHSTSYVTNIGLIQEQNSIERNVKGQSNVLDIEMETGTGKTYTYTKTMFELNKSHGIFKFVIVVPTLAIKAGTIDFLRSESARQHFNEQYGKTINLHIVESKKSGKGKKSYMPHAVTGFVNAGRHDKTAIQVLIINAGMLLSGTMEKRFDTTLYTNYSVPLDAISATEPFVIVDEPHKFDKNGKAWNKIENRLKPQFVIRYGATFKENENLIYQLTAVDAFNQNLVKGVIAHIQEFESGKEALVKFLSSDGTEASFGLTENGKKNTVKLAVKESLEKVHPAMKDLKIEKLNKNTVKLSNGLELDTKGSLNPYSYTETLQETMIQKAVKNHFEIEKKYLDKDVKIKPLTLFFIDNISSYRPDEGSEGFIKTAVEKYVTAEIKALLKSEEKGFFRTYLEQALIDVSKTHGGYFSKDKANKSDAEIVNELNLILHDKQAILDLNNPMRFIFSKWTLREGWDNPNVFQICKLRSSGSDISKLQEVGRGLRLPVNEYGNRVKSEQHSLHYFVDFTEKKFVEELISEINRKSNAISREITHEKLTPEMVEKIIEKYSITEDDLFEKLGDGNVIKMSHEFKDGGFDYIKSNYPLIFEGIGSDKIRKASSIKKKLKVRTEKYSELKGLWEQINENVILEYDIQTEEEFKALFSDFLSHIPFEAEGIREKIVRIEIEKQQAIAKETITLDNNELTTLSTMEYSGFLKELSKELKLNLKTVHECLLKCKLDPDKHLNFSTIREMTSKFQTYLLDNAMQPGKFKIKYKKVQSSIHPTKYTDKDGNVKDEINASDVGGLYSEGQVAGNYLFEELFYDSDLEKENIETSLTDVVVFAKIPKGSIKIPVAGGFTYSPDFAYVLKDKNGGKNIHFILETKGATKRSLRGDEAQKIKHAEQFFGEVGVRFETQYSKSKITKIIEDVYGS